MRVLSLIPLGKAERSRACPQSPQEFACAGGVFLGSLNWLLLLLSTCILLSVSQNFFFILEYELSVNAFPVSEVQLEFGSTAFLVRE